MNLEEMAPEDAFVQLRPFFMQMAEALDVFKYRDMPMHNCAGFLVLPKKKSRRNERWVMKFLCSDDIVISADIFLDQINKNPKDEIERLLEYVNAAVKQAKKEFGTSIHLLRGNELDSAMKRIH